MKPRTPVAALAAMLLGGFWLGPNIPAKLAADPGITTVVVLHLAGGDVTIALRPAWAPGAAAAFSRNCERGAFDGTILHIAWDGAIGGGKYEADGGLRLSPAAARTTARETGAGIPWTRGRVAFRPYVTPSGEADAPEFIISLGGELPDMPFTVFGEVVAGLDVLDELTTQEVTGDEIPVGAPLVERAEVQTQ